MQVRQQDDVIEAIPGRVAYRHRAGQATDVLGCFDQLDPMAFAGQSQRQRRAEQAGADDGDVGPAGRRVGGAA